MTSTISSSPLAEGLRDLATFTTLLSKMYKPGIAKLVLGFFGFSSTEISFSFFVELQLPRISLGLVLHRQI